jgi:molybdopterin molybdotransferase
MRLLGAQVLSIEDYRNSNCAAGAKGTRPLSVNDAIETALGLCYPISETERIPLRSASGRILGEDVVSLVDLPLFDNSAMDGYAVSLSDLSGDGPWTLPIIGRAPAGYSQQGEGLETNGAVQIFTGALVPSSFDAVVIQEDCEVLGDQVVVKRRPVLRANIRRKGESLRCGDVACDRGEQLGPVHLALLASLGTSDVVVFRKIRIGLIANGAELSRAGGLGGPSHIYESNGIMLSAIMSAYPWVDLHDFGIVTDSPTALSAALTEAEGTCDVILTTGGVSAGEEDHVVAAFRNIGGSIEVSQVAMRPGKPVKIGATSRALFAGLPGNPNATLLAFQQIVLPAIKKISGCQDWTSKRQAVSVDFSYAKKPGRTDFLPVRTIGRDDLGLPVVTLAARPSSSDLVTMADADGVLVLPPSLTSFEEGSQLAFDRFPWRN